MKRMPFSRLVRSALPALCAVGLALFAAGCVIAVGNEGNPTRHITVGQELTDLKKARDNGVITEEEYQAQRQRILGKPDEKH